MLLVEERSGHMRVGDVSKAVIRDALADLAKQRARKDTGARTVVTLASAK